MTKTMLLSKVKIEILLLIILFSTADGFWRRRRRRRRSSPGPDTTRPSFGSTCPPVKTIRVAATTARVPWSVPTATDNRGTPTVTWILAKTKKTPFVSSTPAPPQDTTPPTFSNCPSPWTVTVTTSPSVTWTEPTASDNLSVTVHPDLRKKGGFPGGPVGPGVPEFCPSLLDFNAPPSRSGLPPGSVFSEGRHSIVYTARDGAGNTATCVVTFTVVTIRCPRIGASPQRYFTCSNGNIAYSRCTFTCATGYNRVGSSSVTCQNSGSWRGSFPTCAIGDCGEPPNPKHGSKSCTSYTYGGTCSFQCNSGFTLSGPSSRVCDGHSWSETPPSCRDTQAPSFSTCQSNIVARNDNRVTTAVVRYATPVATDNSGSAPLITKTNGQASGSTFSSGTHEIRYRATDGSGNHADCSFSVTVKVVSCPNILSQSGRTHSCPHGPLKGAICSFRCEVGFTMSGTATVTCNSNGDWNRGFPNCNGVTCPQLSAPSSGSISSCSRSFGSICTFSCNPGYELVGSSSRQCSHRAGQSVGFWTGSPSLCQRRVRRSAVQSTVHVSLPGLPCQSTEDELEIKNQLLSQLSSRRKDIPCLNRERCFIGELSIFNCGTSSSKGPSSSHPFAVIYLSQNRSAYNVELNDGSDDGLHESLQESINFIKDLMRQKELDFWFKGQVMALDNSTIDVDGWDVCPPGTIESNHEGFCYACQPGTHRSYSVQGQDLECELCPLNSYQENEAADVCIPCPAGLRTLQMGSKMKSDCLGSVEYDSQKSYLEMDESFYQQGISTLAAYPGIIFACSAVVLICAVAALVYRSRGNSTHKLLINS